VRMSEYPLIVSNPLRVSVWLISIQAATTSALNEESRLNYEWAISADRQACHIYEC
jgi:hypothetical protein